MRKVTHTGATDVAVLAGGLGTRLRSEIGQTQKTMAAVGDRPFLFYLLKQLKQQGFRRVILCTGYQARAVEDFFSRESLGLDIAFSREDAPLGTGGAVKKAAGLVESDPFLILNGDSFCDMDYGALLSFHSRQRAVATLTLSAVSPRADVGSVVVNASGLVVGFQEKSPADNPLADGHQLYVNAGVYSFSRNIFSLMPRREVFSLEKDVFPALTGEPVYGFVIKEGFMDIGTPQRYAEAQKNLKSF